MTGRENVEFLATTLNSGRDIKKDSTDKIIQFADIGEFIDQPVKTYSSGMFVRLAFAMNIINAPDILIVDEALSVGDIIFQQKCMRSLHEFCKKGTVLFVSHDTSSVKKICTKALWIEGGRIREFGDAKDVCDRYIGAAHESFGKDYNSENVTEIIANQNTASLVYGNKIVDQTKNLVQAPDNILNQTKTKINLLTNFNFH